MVQQQDFVRGAPRVAAGNPAQVVGDARAGDQRWLDAEPALRSHYEAWASARPVEPA